MRRARLFILAILAVSTAAIAGAVYLFAGGMKSRPNVLLITLDTTRADRVGCYGYRQGISPHLDALAAQGVLFEKAYTTASVTPVSHASILTGQNPYVHGLRVLHGLGDYRLGDDAVTLAEILKGADYRTAAFISAFPAGSRFGLAQGFDLFDEAFVESADEVVNESGAVNTAKSQRRADATTDAALQWFAETPDRFFVWLHYFDPHDTKVVPPPEFLEQFEPASGSAEEQAWLQALATNESRKWMLKRVYDIEVQYMDQQIGRVLDALEAAGRLRDTVVVVIADHGQGLGDHNWWTHGILYQEQIRAPFIIRAPNVPAGRRVEHLVRAIDIVPTVVELAGLGTETYGSIDGESLVPMLLGEVTDPGYVAYADSVNMLTYASEARTKDLKHDMLFAIIDGRWKYIRHALRPSESELYDLVEDPGELNNLYAAGGSELERLQRNLDARPYHPDQRPKPDRLSDADRERLRSLGYAE